MARDTVGGPLGPADDANCHFRNEGRPQPQVGAPARRRSRRTKYCDNLSLSGNQFVSQMTLLKTTVRFLNSRKREKHKPIAHAS